MSAKMPLFFNLQTLEIETNNDSDYIVAALYYFYKGIIIPKSSRDRFKPVRKLREGSSFLLNPASFFLDTKTENIYKAQYIKLAGRRSYMDYVQNHVVILNLSMYPDINLSAIKTNPIIKIIDNHIHFKYEEIIPWH